MSHLITLHIIPKCFQKVKVLLKKDGLFIQKTVFYIHYFLKISEVMNKNKHPHFHLKTQTKETFLGSKK